jgi:hypothetical protein
MHAHGPLWHFLHNYLDILQYSQLQVWRYQSRPEEALRLEPLEPQVQVQVRTSLRHPDLVDS